MKFKRGVKGGNGAVTVVVYLMLSTQALAGVAAESAPVAQVARDFGVELRPLHPGTLDPELQRYFTIETRDADTAQRLIERLSGAPGVEAAYIKPPEGPP